MINNFTGSSGSSSGRSSGSSSSHGSGYYTSTGWVDDSTPAPTRLTLTRTQQPTTSTRSSSPKTTSPSVPNLNSQHTAAPQRLDLNDLYQGASGQTPGSPDATSALASLGNIPGQLYESPLSVANVLTGSRTTISSTLGGVRFGKSSQGVVDQISHSVGQVPVLGQALGAAGDAVTALQAIPAQQRNQQAVRSLAFTQGKPDSALMRDVDPTWTNLTNPLDFIGVARGFNATVGDFRKEMAARGLTVGDLGKNVADNPTSANSLEDMGFRVGADPTNLLFVAGGPIKMAEAVARGFGFVDRLAQAGKILPKAIDAASSAKAIAEGNTAAATLPGLATFIQRGLSLADKAPSLSGVLKAYQKVAVGTELTLGAVNWTTGELAKNPDVVQAVPALQGLHDLSQQMLDNKPLSRNAAFSLLAAYSLPFHEIKAVIKRPIAAVFDTAKGGGGAFNALADKIAPEGLGFGEKKTWLAEHYGGTQGVKQLLNFIDNKLAADDIVGHEITNPAKPALANALASVDEAGARTVQYQRAIADHAERMRADGRITNLMRTNTYREWFGRQAGIGSDYNLVKTGDFSQPWDANIAADTWQRYVSVASPLGSTLIERGDAAIGYQDMLYTEHVAQAQSLFKAAAGTAKQVPFRAFQEIVNRYPQLMIDDTKDYFVQRLAAKEPVPLDSIRGKLNDYAKYAVPLDTLTHEAAALERAAPKVDATPTGSMVDGAVVEPNGNGVMTPQYADSVLGQGDPLRAGTPSAPVPKPSLEDSAALRHASDSAALGPVVATENVAKDAAAADMLANETGLAWGSRNALDNGARADLAAMQEFVQSFPGYRLVNSPKLVHLLTDAPPAIADSILKQTALWEWLKYSGPTAPLARGIEMLTAKPTPGTIAAAMHQAMYNALLPRGATVKQVDEYIGRITAETHRWELGGYQVFRNAQAIVPGTLKGLAEGKASAQIEAVFGADTIKAVNADFKGWDRLVDQAHNRVFQAAQRTADSTTANIAKRSLASLAEKVYTTWQGTIPGRAARIGTKTLYPIMRFISDPRWWLMNEYEVDALGGLKYGMGSTRLGKEIPMTPASIVHDPAYGGYSTAKQVADKAAARVVSGEDTGQAFGSRHVASIVNRTFDKNVRESIDQTLNTIGETNPVFADLVAKFGANQSTWADQIYNTLYSLDGGIRNAIGTEAELAGQRAADIHLAPFYDKLYEIHTQALKDMKNVLAGNAERSNLERLMNHPLLYWPLSYQLKAAKWMFDVMTDKSFGHQTNFGGAYTLANLEQAHKERMATNPAYAQFFNDHPALWQLAQQIVPITPWDLGVSLSRPVRYAGGWLGAWGAYKAASTPQGALLAVMNVGPLYTATLIGNLWGELSGNRTQQITVPVKPASAKAAH